MRYVPKGQALARYQFLRDNVREIARDVERFFTTAAQNSLP